MGIQGLLPALKSIIAPVHVRTYAGKKAAIDTYSWLHKAAYSCSKELCEGRPTEKFIDYCMHRVKLLRHHGVQPVMIFDGGVLPMKADQEAKRARSRKDHLERAQVLERLGNHKDAYGFYQKAVDITPTIASKLIKALKKEGVQYIVAPYEADAQMAYLAIHGHVDVIITEDSDLIAYGCPQIFFKMDNSGQGEEFQYCDLVRNKDLNFSNFTKQMVLEMCVMTGCDYLPSLPGMGIKKAHGLIRRFKSYQKVVRHLRFSGTTISVQYEELFQRALLTFHHQRVYDPVSQRMVHLTDVPDDVTVDLEFVGPDLAQDLVTAIAVGDVDPSTNLPFQDALTVAEPALPPYDNVINQFVARKRVEMTTQKNVLTNYFLSESVEAKKQFSGPRTVSCNEKQSENRPPKYTLDSLVPVTQGLASTPEAEIFGTPLPDDVEEDGAPGVDEQTEVDGLEPHEEIRRRLGFVQAFRFEIENAPLYDGGWNSYDGHVRKYEGPPIEICDPVGEDSFSSVIHRFSFESATPTDLCATFSGKDRKKSIVDAPPFKRSGYFSLSQPVRSGSSKLHNVDSPTCVIERELKYVDSCGIEVTKKRRIDYREVALKKAEAAGPSGQGSQPPAPFDKFIHPPTRRSVARTLSSLENRNSASSVTVVPRDIGRSEVGVFSTNVSHVAQFANIAQKSVEKFAESIENFRWSSKGGARASGLRAPMAAISANTATRIGTNGLSTLGGKLNEYACSPSTFRPPRKITATNGAVRAQENDCPSR